MVGRCPPNGRARALLFLFVSQLLSLGQAASHKSRVGALAAPVHAEARFEEERFSGGMRGRKLDSSKAHTDLLAGHGRNRQVRGAQTGHSAGLRACKL